MQLRSRIARVAALAALLMIFAIGCGAPDGDSPPDGAASVKVLGLSPRAGATNVALDAPIIITFDAAMDPESFSAERVRTAPSVTLQLQWDDARRALTARPEGGWSEATTYTLTLDAALRASDGRTLGAPFGAVFSTVTQAPPPTTPDEVYDGPNGERATAVAQGDEASSRVYTLRSDAPLRDNLPEGGQVTIAELPDQMTLRSGSVLFDALFAMAIEEARQCSVSSISDGAFNEGRGVPCDCFETGEKWRYVWTRDTAYAMELGLAVFDPQRSRRSLDYKLSARKGSGDDLQIVQDTGSGGSYPVSTDRVVWALGAMATIKALDGAERDAFAARAFEAMRNTAEHDRRVVYDPTDGLYRGEQSFLDWREQSYPSWTRADTVALAMSKALSTNAGHHAMLSALVQLGPLVGEDVSRYAQWADALAEAINAQLWLEDASQFSTMKTSTLDPAPLHKFDLLGTSLAVLGDIADPTRASRAVASYPHGELGPPVLWPQQPLIPIYHNRGIWPFVTAYGLLAARRVNNAAVFDHDLESLVRGAALNLSHMENFEFQTQRAWVDDGEYSGPVVNSRRQLWSVAGHMGAVLHGVFGMELSLDGVRFQPFVTPALRANYARGTSLELRAIPYRGKTLDVTLVWDADAPADATLAVVSATLDGAAIDPQTFMTPQSLPERAALVLTLGTQGSSQQLNVVRGDDFRLFFAPREPNLQEVTLSDDRLRLSFDSAGEEGVRFNIYRDGRQVAARLTDGEWTDPESGDHATVTHCYAVEAEFITSNNRSHHSPARCYWGGARIMELSAYAMRLEGQGQWSTMHGRPHFEDFGDPEDALEIGPLRPRWRGEHWIQLVYGNGAGAINTGITAAVKSVVVWDVTDAEPALVTRQVIVMPHLGDWSRWSESTLVPVTLDSDRLYIVRIEDDVNMSYFSHFEPYTGGLGGGQSVYNRANITALKLLPRRGQDSGRGAHPLVAFDGSDDLAKHAPSQRITPGAPAQPWSGFAMSWDADALYITLTSEAFGAPYKTMNLYLEAAQGALPAATPSQGIEYSGLTPALAFTPNLLISARRMSEDGSGEGPWTALRSRVNDQWAPIYRPEPGRDLWMSADQHTLSLRIPRALLGGATRLRLAGHVVNAEPAREWQELLPYNHTPWRASASGYYELDLSGAGAVSDWQVR